MRGEQSSIVRNASAAVGDGMGGFSIQAIHLGAPGPGEVLIALKASGVCHTDWDSLSWGRRVILGHEGAGLVDSVGEGVTRFRAGDRVLLNWAIPCGVCFQCERGNESICEDRGTVPDARYQQPGYSSPGGSDERASARNTGAAGPGGLNASFSLGTMATHAVVPQAAVLPLPADVSFEIGAIFGCAVMTGFGSAVNAARVASGSTVVVLGCGGVGLSTILGARYCNAARILAIDLNPGRLEMALQFGATETLLAHQEDVGLLAMAARVRQATTGRGAEYAFECTAVPELGAAPLAMIRSGGTAVGVSGIEKIVPVNMEVFEWNKTYINPLYGGCRPQRDFPLMLGLYQSGKLPLEAMITRRYPLQDLGQAFDDMRSGNGAKGVLIFE